MTKVLDGVIGARHASHLRRCVKPEIEVVVDVESSDDDAEEEAVAERSDNSAAELLGDSNEEVEPELARQLPRSLRVRISDTLGGD